MGDTALGIFQETLIRLIRGEWKEFISIRETELISLNDEINYMRGFLKLTEKKRYKYPEVMNLVKQIKDIVSEAENIVELFVVQAVRARNDGQAQPSLHLGSVIKEINTLTAQIKQIYDENMYDLNGVADKKLKQFNSKTEGSSSSQGAGTTPKRAKEKEVVGFKEDVDNLMGTLCGSGEGGPLEIISIIGAAGGGKTTLAGEVYDHPLMSHNFEIRAWLNVSQEYDMTMKRNLLIRILELAFPKELEDYEKSGHEDKLGEITYNCLKGKKYLIVMDDIWDTKAWDDIQRSFPNNCNGSKVLFTSRLLVEPNNIRCVPYILKQLSKSCSWKLLQNKVFTKKCCPSDLVSIGEHIAEKCEGLPLAIVTIGGILAVEDKTTNVWEKISERLSSIIAENPDTCMKILELSYNHLPLHLKACFLYMGGFPEDSEILVRELIWLWIAEGFVQQSEGDKSLEDIAKDYLQNLIDRSLVIEARKRSCGGIKACHIHDLLRQLCLIKAEEDNFLVQIHGSGTFSPSIAIKYRRLFIGRNFFFNFSLRPEFSLRPCERNYLSLMRRYSMGMKFFPKFSLWPSVPNIRSFMCLSLEESALLSFHDLSFFAENFELLRVLHLSSVKFQVLGGGHLVHLRYLALELPRESSEFLWSSLYLFNLETLYIRSPIRSSTGMAFWEPKTIPLPHNIFKMVKLRHLYAKMGAFEYHDNVAAGIDFGCSPKLDSLETLHSICPCEKCLKFLIMTPNLRKLGFWGNLISDDNVLMFPDLEFLNRLETLNFGHNGRGDLNINLPSVLKFPPTIMRLTLKNTWLKWEALSVLQTLPSLEVLKLLSRSCIGKIWETTELEFSHLKYLKMDDVYLKEWNASEDQFPRLEILVVKNCRDLKGIPIDFAKLNELREIDVRGCVGGIRQSAMDIQEERRKTLGDDGYINLLT